MKRKFIYLSIAATLAMPQLLQAQNVGIGTTTPTAALEVSSSNKVTLKASTDSSMGYTLLYTDFPNYPAAIKGDFVTQGFDDGSGVLGNGVGLNEGYGTGVTGIGGWIGVLGLGMPNADAAIVAHANGAAYALKVFGKSSFSGELSTGGDLSTTANIEGENITAWGDISAAGNIATSGTITIAGGNPGAGKVLTSTGTSGAATWQTPAVPVTSKVMSIGFAAFTTYGVYVSSYLQTSTTNGGWVSLGQGLSPLTELYAPVNLPDGATVTRIKAFYVNNTTNNVELTLVKNNYFNSVVNTINVGSIALTGASTSIASIVSTTLNHLVSNASSQYYISLKPTTAWSGISNFKLGWVEITYTN